MYERFTDRARRVMMLANKYAQSLNHEYLGTEHIVVGLVDEGSGVASIVLKNLGVKLCDIRKEVEKVVQASPASVTMGKLPHTPRAKRVIEYAIEEAKELSHNYVGSEHLLLGLVREEEGVAGQILKNLGVERENVREEVLQLVGVKNPPASIAGQLDEARVLCSQITELLGKATELQGRLSAALLGVSVLRWVADVAVERKEQGNQ